MEAALQALADDIISNNVNLDVLQSHLDAVNSFRPADQQIETNDFIKVYTYAMTSVTNKFLSDGEFSNTTKSISSQSANYMNSENVNPDVCKKYAEVLKLSIDTDLKCNPNLVI